MSLLDRDPRGVVPSPTGTTSIDIGTLAYNNDRLPTAFNGNTENALNFLVAHIFPNYIATVANPAALPGSANPNDYYIVSDDGDGKSAGYVWQVVDGAGKFFKKYDVDWSYEGIYAEMVNRTAYMYMHKYGMTDKDETGADVTGTYAGQTIYGGDATTQNLTLNANSADSTGYVQTDNIFRPTSDNAIDLGTDSERFRTGKFGTSVIASTLTLGGGSITDSSGQVSFDNENLVTTGNYTGTNGYLTSSLEVGPLVGDALILGPGSITDESGNISFGSTNLSTTGTLGAGVTTLTDNLQTIIFDPDVTGEASIIASTGVINFDNENLKTTGTLDAGVITGTQLNIDNIRVDGNTVSSTDTNGNILLVPDGTGIVDVQKTLQTLDIDTTGVVDVTGQLNVDNLRLDGNTLSSTDVDGNVYIDPNGEGALIVSSEILPTVNNTQDFGNTSFRWNDLYMGGNISNGTNDIAVGTLLSFRSGVWRDLAQTQPAQAGDALFYDAGNGVWLASAPDSEISHSSLNNLNSDDHTQYALLAGRATGQTLIGGSAASENLTLQSTSDVTRGAIKLNDDLEPTTTAAYSGGWTGTDLGGASFFFNDLYMRGEGKNFRFENFTNAGLPSSSGQNIGRAIWTTDTKKFYIDDGSTLTTINTSKFLSDTAWNGSDTTKDVTVSASIADARNAIWALHDNTNDFDRIYCSIKAISATQVRITVNPALPAGSYRLIGLE